MSQPVMPPKAIAMMENHDQAYYAWKERGIRGRTLVHIDAHIDFGWIPEIDLDEIDSHSQSLSSPKRESPLLNPFLRPRAKMVNIGNYICPAIREGMVNKLYWVIPDASWKSPRGRRYAARQLRELLKIKRSSAGRLRQDKNQLSCRILDTDVIVCNLENLAPIEDAALVDIDVDFLLTPRIWDDLNPERWPWIFPRELYAKIASKISKIEVLTIAYSVEGGYTPLKFKYLGDELRSLFEHTLSAYDSRVMDYKRKSVFLAKAKKPADAAAAYEQALLLDDRDASIYFNLAILYLDGELTDLPRAKQAFDEAVRRDRSYATVYNNYGILYLRYNRLKDAQIEYRKFLRMNIDNPPALNGLGHISLAQRRFSAAGEFFDRCLAADNNYPEARLGKGIVSFKQGRIKEAEELFAGLKQDQPDEAEIYWWLGCIAQKRGEIPSAIENYKAAVLRGGEGPLVHLRLARHYLAKKFYYRAFEELKRSFRSFRILT